MSSPVAWIRDLDSLATDVRVFSCDLDLCGHILDFFIAMTWIAAMTWIFHRVFLVLLVFGYFIASAKLVYSPVL